MTNSQAFWDGFWSVWDLTRPFSEKPQLRYLNEEIDEQWEQYPDSNMGIWEVVGNYLYKAIDNYNRELSNVPKQ